MHLPPADCQRMDSDAQEAGKLRSGLKGLSGSQILELIARFTLGCSRDGEGSLRFGGPETEGLGCNAEGDNSRVVRRDWMDCVEVNSDRSPT